MRVIIDCKRKKVVGDSGFEQVISKVCSFCKIKSNGNKIA